MLTFEVFAIANLLKLSCFIELKTKSAFVSSYCGKQQLIQGSVSIKHCCIIGNLPPNQSKASLVAPYVLLNTVLSPII